MRMQGVRIQMARAYVEVFPAMFCAQRALPHAVEQFPASAGAFADAHPEQQQHVVCLLAG